MKPPGEMEEKSRRILQLEKRRELPRRKEGHFRSWKIKGEKKGN